MNEQSTKAFPPGIGWLPTGVALGLLLLISFVAVVPHYTNQPVSAAAGGGYGASGPTGSGGGGGGGSGGGGYGASGPTGSGGGGSGGGGGTGSYAGGSQGHYEGGGPGSGGGGSGGGGSSGGGSSGSGGGPVGPTNAEKQAGNGELQVTQSSQACKGGPYGYGVSANSIDVASTIVTTGIGAGFLGQAADGMQAAINQVNGAGGICGRQVHLHTLNSGWDSTTGAADIKNWIDQKNIFALVGEPDSEGLKGALNSDYIDPAQIPVVGTDGMLADQYNDQFVWPVAASTVTNMHIVAQYAFAHLGVTKASQFGIVYDTAYSFGKEGADAFDHEVKRLTGQDIPGYGQGANCTNSNANYCGISSQGAESYTQQVNSFDSACANTCKAVVLLLEPQPAEAWMNAESGHSWYQYLFGGEPLFDTNVANNCDGCGSAGMLVWTGYKPAIAPFASDPNVANFCNLLRSVNPNDDCTNEFTEGAFLGTELFLAAANDVAAAKEPLTRANLKAVLDSQTFDLGLTPAQLQYSTTLPHLANKCMAMFKDNYAGAFEGWSYQNTGFVCDSHSQFDLSTS